MRVRPHYFWGLSQNEGAPPLMRARPHYLGALQNQQALIHFPNLPPPPTCLQHQLIPPPPLYLGQGGTTYPSTPFDLKSSIATSWPRDGFLTTSQAITMNPRSQWSLFGGAVCKGATPSVEQPGGRGFKPRLRSLLD